MILHKHPLITSARKVKLYSWWEMLRLVWRMVFRQGKTLRSREAVYLWYDGRR